jgi:transcriptional regulator with XRE-family HTH domain
MDADELKGKRKALEMTQAQLAEALGVNIMTVSRWERGFKVYTIALIAGVGSYRSKTQEAG